ncbi:winged helix-turn-helix domain-containing protein [Brevibacterium album]|uniref:winged helix-turn-helix domain-containing protein n=1 Tax=Brevibacterium album TaxID=417948 RepID=UPI0003FBDED1|nr:winged helix-turn-helix domain-containing protein [Brevibacterium album]
MTAAAPQPEAFHPRSARAARRTGARLTPVDPQSAPRTYGPAGVSSGPRAARGIVLYVGLDEAKAAAEGTNLAAIAQALKDQVSSLAGAAETQAIIALAPEGLGSDIDAVRAVAVGSQAATGSPAGLHGPVRQRIPSRVAPPATREQLDARAGARTEAARTRTAPGRRAPLREQQPAGRQTEGGLGGPLASAAQSGPYAPEAHSGVHEPPYSYPAADAPLRIDIPRREVHIDGAQVPVTTKEFDLLATLVSHPGATLSREDLIDALWGTGEERPDARTVDVHIRRLRRRLGAHSAIVRTMRGAGYRYDEHPDVAVWQARASR